MITDNFTELADRLRARHPLVGQLALRLGDARVVLASDSRALLAELFGYFRPFLDPHDPSAPAAAGDLELLALESPPMALSPELERQLVIRPPEPGKDSIKESSLELSGGRLIRKLRTGLTFLISDAVHLAIGPCCKNPNQIVNFVNNRLIERRLQQGWSLCHAAGVSRRGRGLAIAGLSGRGKSTLALHILERDAFDYLSNDRLLIRRGGAAPNPRDALAALGVPKLPRINPGTALSIPRLAGLIPEDRRRELEALTPAQLWQVEEKYDVDVEAAYGPGRVQLAAELVGLLVLTWRFGGGPTQIRPASLHERRDLLAAVMKTPGLFYTPVDGEDPNQLDEAAYLAAFGDVPVYELSGGADFAAAVDFSSELLS
jgi:HprK-related kinase B